MDVFREPDIHTVTVKKAAQVTMTTVILNIIGYHIDQEPAPILFMLPTEHLAEAVSKDRLAPMIADSPRLRAKVSEVKSRTSSNTLLHKGFPGGHLTLVGANSPANLSSRPARIILCDETDRAPQSAGKEGNPFLILAERAATFWNRKFGYFSSPTLESISFIDSSFKRSDQRHYYVPCPHCGVKHPLEWQSMLLDKNDIEGTCHVCPECGSAQYDGDKPGMLAKGDWRAHKPEVKGHAGFFLSQLYSPWVAYATIARKYWDSRGDHEAEVVFANTVLGWAWREGKSASTVEKLMDRRENYTAEVVPWGGVVITIGVDVQDNRLEWEVVAWGRKHESWSLEYRVVHGDPGMAGGVWALLESQLKKTYLHESGLHLNVVACAIDIGGHFPDEVYRFCRPRWGRGVYAVMGDGGGIGKPVVTRPRPGKKRKTDKDYLCMIGSNACKDTIGSFLRKEMPEKATSCPGYCHFPADYDHWYFEQMLSEVPKVKAVHGKRVRQWVLKKTSGRNEVWDCRNYAYAALKIQGRDVDQDVDLLEQRVKG